MDLSRLSLATKLITGAAILLLIDTFLNWQQVCFSALGNSSCSGVSGWHGAIGVLLGIFTIFLIAWEVVKVVGVDLPELPVEDRLVELGAAGGVVVLVILKFLSANEVRHWWVQIVGLLCAAAIAYGLWLRMQGQEDGAAASSEPAAPAATPTYTPPAATPPPADEPPSGSPSSDDM